MSISAKLIALNTAKQSIKTALVNKGVNVSDIPFTDYGSEVASLPSPKVEETKTVTPNFAGGNVVVTPDANKVLTQVTVVKDSDLVPENIVKDVNIFGVVGTAETGGGGSGGYTVSITQSNRGGSISIEWIDGSGHHTDNVSGTNLVNVYWIKLNSISYEGSEGSLTITGATENELLSGKVVTGPISISIYSVCLTGDTLITLSDGTVERLDELREDATLLSVDLSEGKIISSKVLYLVNNNDQLQEKPVTISKTNNEPNVVVDKLHTYPQYQKYTFDDGTVIKEVVKHRFYNLETKQFTHLIEWNIGDRIYKQDGTTPKLLNKEIVLEPTIAYTVNTMNHTGFANGCLHGDRHANKYPIEIVNGVPKYVDRN